VGGGALSIGGTSYSAGLGTHSRSTIEIRFVRKGRVFAGKAGMDDGTDGLGHARFLIFGADRRQLWSSGHMKTGDPARPFSVPLEGQSGDLLLVVEPAGSNRYGHADWVDLQVLE
jgi:alpha-galactosidase